MRWLSKLILTLVVVFLPGICLAGTVPGYKTGYPIVYAITPDGAAPVTTPPTWTGHSVWEPEITTSLSAAEALSDNTPWLTSGTSVTLVYVNSVTLAWSSGVSDTTDTAIFDTIESPYSGATCPWIVTSTGDATPDNTSGFDTTAVILSGSPSTNSGLIRPGACADPYGAFYISKLQFQPTGPDVDGSAIYVAATNGPGILEISDCYIDGQNYDSASGEGIRLLNTNQATMRIWNTVIKDFASGWVSTVHSVSGYNVSISGATSEGMKSGFIYNSSVFNNVDDFNIPIVVSFCASDDNEGSDAQNLNENAGGEWTAAFEDWTVGDFRAKAGGLLENTGTGVAAWITLLGNTDPLATDMAGNARSGATPEIGPFEITAAATSGNAQRAGRFLIKPNDYQKKFPEFRKIVR